MFNMNWLISLVLLVMVLSVRADGNDDDEETVPKCEFDKFLDPKLLCQLYDKVSMEMYPEGQKFCACPSYSECVRKVFKHPLTNIEHQKFLCYKQPLPANKHHFLDMTEGLLRKDRDYGEKEEEKQEITESLE